MVFELVKWLDSIIQSIELVFFLHLSSGHKIIKVFSTEVASHGEFISVKMFKIQGHWGSKYLFHATSEGVCMKNTKEINTFVHAAMIQVFINLF